MIQLIGVPDNGSANAYLEKDDPCFGKYYAKTAPECMACLALVVSGGEVRFLRELCQSRTKGSTKLVDLVRLTSTEVLQEIESGATAPEIFRKILGDNDPKLAAAAARQLLADRIWYLNSLAPDGEFPEVPKTKEML